MTMQVEYPVASVENKMNGESVFIVGSGPSLDDIDEAKLSDRYIYALNHSYKLFLDNKKYPDAWWFFCDRRAYLQMKDVISRRPIQAVVDKRGLEMMRTLRQAVRWVWYPRGAFYLSRTITEVALQMADFCGFDRAYLVGIDAFRVKPGQPYTEKVARKDCHFMNPKIPDSELKSSREFIKQINIVAEKLKRLKVFVCSDLYPIEESPLFSKASFEEALNAPVAR